MPILQRKKNKNKQSVQAVRKTTVQHIHYTEQLRLPTHTTMELKSGGCSMEIKKVRSKKMTSKKVRISDGKQTGYSVQQKIRKMLKEVKMVKLVEEKTKSQGRSKSKQKIRKSGKKMGNQPIYWKINQQLGLTAKLEKTLQKIKESNYFKDDQQVSQIPLISTSQTFAQQETKHQKQPNNGQNFDQINIHQFRMFCNKTQPSIRMNIHCVPGNIYEIMAKRIQRVWRRYRTHQLIKQYAGIRIGRDQRSPSPIYGEITKNKISPQQLCLHHTEITAISNLQQSDEYFKKQQTSKQCYKQQQQKLNQFQSQTRYRLTNEQLEKWKEQLTVVENNQNKNYQNKDKLLQKLISKLKVNKESIQVILINGNLKGQQYQQIIDGFSQKEKQTLQLTHYLQKYRQQNNELTNNKDQQQKLTQKQDQTNKPQLQERKLPHQQSSLSQDSLRHIDEQFNCKKYIQYLDSDIYPIAPHQKNSMRTIGRQEQQKLLKKLQKQDSSKRMIKGSKILGSGQQHQELEFEELIIKSRLSCRSNSQLSSNQGRAVEQIMNQDRSPRRGGLKLLKLLKRKSISQKIIKYISLGQINNLNDPVSNEQKGNNETIIIVNSQKINDENHGGMKVESQALMLENERKGVEEDMQLLMQRQLDQFDWNEEIDQPHCEADMGNDKKFIEDCIISQMAKLQQIIEDNSQNQIKTQPSHNISSFFHRSLNHNLQQYQQQNSYENENIQINELDQSQMREKGDLVTEKIIGSLALEILAEMAQNRQTLLVKFKEMMKKKTKIKRSFSKQKKYGFATNQAQIKNFVDELCAYVLIQQPQILKNLQKSTGPSALQLLSYMHQSFDDEINIDNQQDDPSVMILPNWIFQYFWARKGPLLRSQKYSSEQDSQKLRQEHLKELNKIFLRSCFDCLNECLQHERNYGMFGKAFPWKTSHLFHHTKSVEQNRRSLEHSRQRVLAITQNMCGVLPENQQLTYHSNEEELLLEQENRISKILIDELLESQPRWVFYDDEESQILIETSNMIFNLLMVESSKVLGSYLQEFF